MCHSGHYAQVYLSFVYSPRLTNSKARKYFNGHSFFLGKHLFVRIMGVLAPEQALV